MKTRVLLSFVLIFSAFCMNVKAADPLMDPFSYPASSEGKYTLTSKWLYSTNLGNYGANPGTLAADGMIRGMVVKNGNMLFPNRTDNSILFVSCETGEVVKSVPIDPAFFDFGSNPGGTYTLNGIKKDSKGNILIANLTTSGAQTFRVAKVNEETGAVTILVNTRIDDFYPGNAPRFDLFGVCGDVDGDAVIFAAKSEVAGTPINPGDAVYRWIIKDGVAGDPLWIPADLSIGFGTDGAPAGDLTWGYSANIEPISEDLFYVSAQKIYPTLFQVVENADGDLVAVVVDAFYDIQTEGTPLTPAYHDLVTVPGEDYIMNTTYNSMAQFTIGNENFLVLPAYNYVATNPAPSNFRLFKFKDEDKRFAEMEVLWSFPQNGLGSVANTSYASAIDVEVSDNNIANIYIYVNQNGFGAYEFTVNDEVGISLPGTSSVFAYSADKAVRFNETVASAKVYTVTGQLVAAVNNTSSVAIATQGIYIVKAITSNGQTIVSKVVVK